MTLEFTKGSDAQFVERETLDWIRNNLGLQAFVSDEQMSRTGGWTETFSSEGVSRSAVVKKVQSIAKSLKAKD